MVKACLIKHRSNSTSKELWATNYPAYLTHWRDFSMTESETSQVAIQRFKLKKSVAAIILEILEEDGKRKSRREKTRGWIRRREEKGYFNNIVQEAWYACARQTCLMRLSRRQNIDHQTRERKKCFKLFDQMFDGLQILSNTTKHDQTRSNNTKEGGQTVKCVVTKQCLMVFGRQTFRVWIGLTHDRSAFDVICSHCSWPCFAHK